MMTPEERQFRRMARRRGKAALDYMQKAMYPVYESDPEIYEDLVETYARQAIQLANRSHEVGNRFPNDRACMKDYRERVKETIAEIDAALKGR